MTQARIIRYFAYLCSLVNKCQNLTFKVNFLKYLEIKGSQKVKLPTLMTLPQYSPLHRIVPPLLHKQQNFLTDVANLTQLAVYSCKTWQKKFFFLHIHKVMPGRFVLLTLSWTITFLIHGI